MISSSLGGVGFNMALASHLSSNKKDPTEKVRLITAIGQDLSGQSILNTMENGRKMDTTGIYTDPKNLTAQYVSVHDSNGELVVACADMDIAAKMPVDHIEKQISIAEPSTVVVDANVSVDALKKLVEIQKIQKFRLIYEPTSLAKSSKIAEAKLAVYPNNEVYLITPTFNELDSIYSKHSDLEKFELDHWFPILDGLQIDKAIRNLPYKISNHPMFKRLWEFGVFQKSFKLLPFFPNIIVKDGKNGISVFSIQLLSEKMSSQADLFFQTTGVSIQDSNKKLCATFEHYDIPFKDVDVKNVTGAGDTFLGVLINEIASSKKDIFENALAMERKDALMKAQYGSKLSIEFEGTISDKLTKYIT